jgi:type VI secretion system protein ImpJ
MLPASGPRMKLLSKVVWSEGMYLGPHHFQAQARHFEDAVHFATSSLWNDPYGFGACELDADALRNGTVSVLHAHGLFQDGLVFDMPACDALPAQRTIGDVFSPMATSLSVYLSVPRRRTDGHNFQLAPQNGSNARYLGDVREMRDENTGRDEKPIQVGRKNTRLIFEGENSEDQLLLAMGRIVRDGSGQFAFDPTFVPPCTRISASSRLLSLLSRLVEILEVKSASVAQEQRSGGPKFQVGMSSRQVAQFWFLHAVNSSLAPLRHLLLSKRSHPHELYVEMLRLAGALCTFGFDVHPRSLPVYDHQRLDQCFLQLDQHIRKHLEIVVPSQAIVIPLPQHERYFYNGEIKDQRCLGPSRWILGVRSNLGEADLIVRTPQFVKFCSAKFVPELVKRALPGLKLSHIPVPPAGVAAKVDYQYFSIDRFGPCWEHILQSKSVGVYVPWELPEAELDLIVLLQD